MSCPTCDHTLSLLYDDDLLKRYWCQRCGTVLFESHASGIAETFVPKLVERCREFEESTSAIGAHRSLWHLLGIKEAIRLPADRAVCVDPLQMG